MIDLHTHSTFSDGSLSPEALVDLAYEAGLSALALTDHDSTEGVPRFMAACGKAGLTGVPGVEISVESSSGTMHLLGFFVDPQHGGLQAALCRIRDGRECRNHRILEILRGLGAGMAWDEVAALAASEVVGRPHIAQAMVAHGYVATRQEAFARFLAKGKPAYVERFKLSASEGVARIREAGGVAVLAHPFTLGLRFRKLRAFIAELVEHGLQGIEVFYPEHGPELRQQYQSIAKEFALVMTGGSDFHGDANPDICIGRGFGNVRVSDTILVDLVQRIPVKQDTFR